MLQETPLNTNLESSISNIYKQASSLKELNLPQFEKTEVHEIALLLMHAQQLNLSPLEAINGILYIVKGRIGMSAFYMNFLIRKAKHSVTRLESNYNEVAILKGKRIDNGDEMIEIFSMEDAQRGGLVNFKDNKFSIYKTFPSDILFWRCLSKLAKKLFPDVLGFTRYTPEELIAIPDDSIIETPQEQKIKTLIKNSQEKKTSKNDEIITKDQLNYLNKLFDEREEKIKLKVLERIQKNYGIEKLENLTENIYFNIKNFVERIKIKENGENDAL